jgi:hypothetical protein
MTACRVLCVIQVKLTGGRVPVLELCVIRSSISWCTSVSVGSLNKIQPLFGHRCAIAVCSVKVGQGADWAHVLANLGCLVQVGRIPARSNSSPLAKL